jgi:hypothetical protein
VNVQLQSAPYRVMVPPMRRGMGQTVTTGGGGGVAALAGGALSSASAVTAAVMIAAGVSGPAAPLVAALGAVLGPLIAKFNGCGQTCIVATSDVNAVGTQMTAAFEQYMEAPVHYASAQQAFLILFNTLMQQLQQACSNPALGTAGQNCIADNSPNACQWKASPGGWSQGANGWTYTYWGAAGSGNSCWNPYTGIYDMVANDPTVVPDGTAVSGGTPTVGTNSTTFAAPVAATGTTTASTGVSLPNLTSLLPTSTEGWLVLGAVALGLVLLL